MSFSQLTPPSPSGSPLIADLRKRVAELSQDSVPYGTDQVDKWSKKRYKAWVESLDDYDVLANNIPLEIECIEPGRVNYVLPLFFAGLKKKGGEVYLVSSIYPIVASFCRYFKKKIRC